MSKQVDERVVSMQFDNKNFESNVQTSLSTLDKLKQKLNFKGAAKGLEHVNDAAKKIDMNGLGSAIGTVSSRFSALEIMGVTALANLTNSAVNAGKRIASALTIDPVKTGFQEYETQINAVQTILANTESKGTTIDDVNKALEELNKYADMTIYNFTEMTRNIGTFTAAGVDLDTSVNAIQGIANLAAVSGSTSQQASTAMYQLSQALSSGTVKLMDWNSVVNAGMGGQVFQDALKETARVHGVAIDDMIKKQGSFRETLSEGWLTSEILTETLQKFTLATEGLSEEQIEANRQMLKAKGYTDEQIESIFKLGNTATNAATKVKTFTQLWDVMKEAAQSGWSQTWKLIIGDFEDAKALLTPLSDFLTGVINKTSEWRNSLLKGALSFNPWQALMKKLESSGLMSIKKYVDGVSDVAKTLEYYQNAMTAVWRGDYKNSDTGRYGLLDAAGYDHRVIQDLVNLSDTYFKGQGHKYQLTIEDVQNSQKKFGVAVSDSTEQVADMSEILANLTDEQLKNAGLTAEEIKLFRELAEEAKRANVPLNELIEQMSKVDGRTLLIDSFKNAGKGLVSVITAIKDAWTEVFPPMTSVQLYNIIKGLNDFSQHLIVSDDTADNLKRTLKGVFAIVHILTTILGGGFKIAFKIVTQLLGLFNLDILDVTAAIGDALVAFDKWIDSALDFTGIFKKMMPYLTSFGKWLKESFGKVKNYFQPAIDAVKNWFSSLKTSDNLAYDIVTGLAKGIVNGTKFIAKAISTLGEKGWAGLKALFSGDAAEGIGSDIISGLVKGIRDGIKIVWDAMIELGTSIINKFKDVIDSHSPSRVFIIIGGFIISGLLIGLKAGFPTIWNTLKDFGTSCINVLSGIDFGALLAVASVFGALFVGNKIANALQNFSEPFSEFGEAMERVSKGAKNWLNAKAMQELAIALAILAGSIVVLCLVPTDKMWHAVGAMSVMIVALGALMGVIGWISKSEGDVKEALNFGKISLVILAMAGSIAIMAASMEKLADIKWTSLVKAGIALAAMGGILAALVFITKYAGKDLVGVGATFAGVAAALLVMTYVMKTVSEINASKLAVGIGAMRAFAAIVAVLMLVTSLVEKTNGGGDIGSSIFKVSLAMLAMVYIAKLCAKMKTEDLVKGITAIVAFGAIVVGLIAATRLAGNGSQALGAGKSILKISVAIGAIAVVAIICSKIKTESLVKGALAITAFGGIIVGLMAATKYLGGGNVEGLGKTILSVSLAIGVLALVATLLGFISIKHLAKGIIAVGLLAAIVSGIILATKGIGDCKANLIALSAAIAVMTIALVALTFIDSAKLASATIALTTIIGVFALLVKATGSLQAGGSSLKNMGTILLLAGVVATFAFVIYKLSSIPDPKTVLTVVASLGTLVLALSASMMILSAIPAGSAGKAAIGALALSAMVVPLMAFVAVLYFMPPIPGHVVNSLKVLIPVMVIMTALLIPLTIVGMLATGALVGIVALTAMVGALWVFAKVICTLPDLTAVEPTLSVLTKFMIIMTGILVAVSIVAPLAVLAIGAMTVMTLLIVAFGALAALIAKLDLGELITDGIPILVAIAEGLGKAIGLFVAGFAGAVMNILPAIGASLSAFMVSAQAFIIGAKMVDDKVLKGVGILAASIIALTVAELINGIAEFMPNSSSFVKLGFELSAFIAAAMPFFTIMSTIDPKVIEGVGILAEAILMLTAANLIDGITRLFSGGESSLSKFGSEVGELGKGVNTFADSVSNLDAGSIEKTKNAAEIIKILAEAAEAIPKTGGLWQGIVGEHNISEFAEGFTDLGETLRDFVNPENGLGNFGKAQVDIVDYACQAIKKFSDVANELPDGGGWLQKLFGDNSLSKFGDDIKNVGEALRTFVSSDGIGTFGQGQVDIVDYACQAIVKFSDAAKNISAAEDGKSFWSKITGSGLDKLGEQLKPLGEGLKIFSESMAGVSITNVSAGANTLKTISDALSNLDENSGSRLTTFGSAMSGFSGFVKAYFNNLKDVTIEQIATSNKIIGMIDDFADGFNSDGVQKASSAMTYLVNALQRLSCIKSATVAGFVDAVNQLGNLSIDELNSTLDSRNFDVYDIGETLVETFKMGIDDALPSVITCGEVMIDNVVLGASNNQSDAETEFLAIISSIVTALESAYQGFYDVGSYLIAGLAEGVLGSTVATRAVRTQVAAMITAAEEEAGIESPSKETMRIGRYMSEGLAVGITKFGYLAGNASISVTKSAIDGMKDSISMVADAINNDVDAQPTIRPVFDLSDIHSGASEINSLFGSRTLAIDASGFGAASASMLKLQNGNNSHELLSTLKGLRKDMTDNPRNSYNLNGISISADSDVANAIETLVRAIKVEGRT